MEDAALLWLAAVGDALLPKLLSGEVWVSAIAGAVSDKKVTEAKELAESG